jgi:hypothetical protein
VTRAIVGFLVLLALAGGVRGQRLVDAAGAELAEASLPPEALKEVERVRTKGLRAGSSVMVVRAVVPAGAPGDGALEPCKGTSRGGGWAVLDARGPGRVASFSYTPGDGYGLCARLCGYRDVRREAPAVAGVIAWLGDIEFEPLPDSEKIAIKGRVTLSGGQSAPDGTIVQALPRNGYRGPSFPVVGGVYTATLGPGQYYFRPKLAGWTSRGGEVRLVAGSPPADADFTLQQVEQITLRIVWPEAKEAAALDVDARGEVRLPLDQRLTLTIRRKDGRHTVQVNRAKVLLNVFQGPFVDGAASLTAIRAAPGSQPFEGELRRGDLITVALNQNSLTQVIEVGDSGFAAVPAGAATAPPAVAASPVADLPDARLDRVIADAAAALVAGDTSKGWALLSPEVKAARGAEATRLARGLHAAAKKVDAAHHLARFVLLKNAYTAGQTGLDQESDEWLKLTIDFADAGVKERISRQPAQLLGAAYDKVRAKRGDGDPQTLAVRFRLARALTRDRQEHLALPHLEVLLPEFEKLKGAESAEVAACLHELGLAQPHPKPEAARPYFARALAIRDKVAGPTSAGAIESLAELTERASRELSNAETHGRDGGRAAAKALEPHLRRLVAARQAAKPIDENASMGALTDLLNVQESLEMWPEAEATLKTILAIPDLDEKLVVWAKLRLGVVALATGRLAEARPLIRAYLDWASKGQVSREEAYNVKENPWMIAPLTELARLDLREGKLADAETGVKRAITISNKFESESSRIPQMDLLIEIYLASKQIAAAAPLAKEIDAFVADRGHQLKRKHLHHAYRTLARYWTVAGRPADAARATARASETDPRQE